MESYDIIDKRFGKTLNNSHVSSPNTLTRVKDDDNSQLGCDHYYCGTCGVKYFTIELFIKHKLENESMGIQWNDITVNNEIIKVPNFVRDTNESHDNDEPMIDDDENGRIETNEIRNSVSNEQIINEHEKIRKKMNKVNESNSIVSQILTKSLSKNKYFRCSHNGCDFISKASMKISIDKHMRTHSGHECDRCGLCFHNHRQFTLHLKSNLCTDKSYRSVNRDRSSTFNSEKCTNEIFENSDSKLKQKNEKSSLIKASVERENPIVTVIVQEQNKKYYNCNDCKKMFTQKTRAVRHLELVHDWDLSQSIAQSVPKESSAPSNILPPVMKRIECSICGIAIKGKTALKLHLLTHTEERKFQCPFDGCSFAFKTKGSMTRHMRRHTGERPFKCDLCGRCFRESGALTRHLKSRYLCITKSDSDLPNYGKERALPAELSNTINNE